MSALVLAPAFLSDFHHLDPEVQLGTLSVMRAYQSGQTPDMEPVPGASDPGVRVIDIAPDWSGVVVPAHGHHYRLLTVRPHDQALEFARGLLPEPLEPAPVDPVPTGPPELSGALALPFDRWRLMLHPDHRRLTESSYNGSTRVTGGPGTGKTVIALHRAAHLAAAETAARPGRVRESILLATEIRTSAQALSDRLDQLLTDPGTRARVRVSTVDALAHSVVRAHTSTVPQMLDGDELAQRWRSPALADGLPFSGRFLVDEWEQVILAQDLRTLPAYIRCERNGRVQHLAPEYRRQVWEAVHRYVDAMRVEGVWAYPQLAAEAARVLDRGEPLLRHAVVADSQDLHPAHWRMLRAAVPEGPDDLFVVGDPQQRTTDHRVSLTSLGIDVRGRGHRLRTAYRTTREILDWAAPVLGHHAVSGPLPGSGTARRAVSGSDSTPETGSGTASGAGTATGTGVGGAGASGEPSSLLHGPEPLLRGCADPGEEVRALGDQVRAWLEAGVAPETIAVAGRNQWVARRVAKELEARGVPTASPEAAGRSEAVRVCTMHRLKGLEFRCVALVGVSDHLLPPKAAIEAAEGDQVALEQVVRRERVLLFTACTRARDALYVSHVGALSRLVQPQAL